MEAQRLYPALFTGAQWDSVFGWIRYRRRKNLKSFDLESRLDGREHFYFCSALENATKRGFFQKKRGRHLSGRRLALTGC